MSTSNVYNTGIMHWAPTRGGRSACGHRRAIMATTGDRFADEPYKCKRCEAKWNDAKARDSIKLVAKQVGMIDMTPTWEGVIPLFIAALQEGTPVAQAAARDELIRLARIADHYAAQKKEAA